MNTKIFLSAAIFALVVTAACSDDKDTTGPEITLINPANEEVFARGDELPIVFDLADPSGINEYKIDIHYADGEHAHTHSLSATLAEADGDEDEGDEELWVLEKTYTDQKGKTSAHVTKTLSIPGDIHGGEYHLGILATDALGNESQVYIDIDIEE
jgi:hypothetical protein